MFERFTERARQVVVLAQDEARTLKHGFIGTEHLLLGLLREGEGLAARVLGLLDITVEEVRAQVARDVGQGDEVTSGQIPFTPGAKKALEQALREALSLGHNYIGTEHILLGLVRENEGVAVRILLDLDAGGEKIRNEIICVLSGSPEDSPSRPRMLIVYCPHCGGTISLGARLEPGAFEASMQGERTCPRCATVWVIDYSVRTKRRDPPPEGARPPIPESIKGSTPPIPAPPSDRGGFHGRDADVFDNAFTVCYDVTLRAVTADPPGSGPPLYSAKRGVPLAAMGGVARDDDEAMRAVRAGCLAGQNSAFSDAGITPLDE